MFLSFLSPHLAREETERTRTRSALLALTRIVRRPRLGCLALMRCDDTCCAPGRTESRWLRFSDSAGVIPHFLTPVAGVRVLTEI